VQLIGEGELEKVVLAREVQVHAARPHDPAATMGVLRAEFPTCFCLCVGCGDATPVAASPELLVRREGQRGSTPALAGSTRRTALLRGGLARCYAGNGIVRGSDPAAELAETEIKLAALLPLLAG